MTSSKDSVNVKILFVEGVLDDHVKLMTGRPRAVSPCHGTPTIQCTEAEACMAAKLEVCRFPPNGEYEAGGACLQGKANGKSTQINCKGQICATSLGPETHQSTTRPMATCHLLRRMSIHALPDRQLIGSVFEDWF